MDTQAKRELVFLHGKNIPQCTATVNKKFIDYYTLQYIDDGKVSLFYDNQHYILQPGTVWAGYPGPHIRFHKTASCPHWNHRYIAFTGPLAQTWATEGLIPKTPVKINHKKFWSQELNSIATDGLVTGGYARKRAINRLENLFFYLAENQTPATPTNEWVEQVINVIHRQGNSPCYKKIADSMCVSERTLRRRFYKCVGMSIHDYVIQNRLQTAIHLLSSTDLSITEIADKLGYRDISYFSRQFTNRLKISPSEFRNSHL